MAKVIKCIGTILVTLLTTLTANATGVLIGDLYYSFSGDEAFVSNKVQGSGSDSWGQCYQKTSYTIPPTVNYEGYNYTVREIEASAFGTISGELKGSSLSHIFLPSTLTAIRPHAFWNCKNLKSIIIPKSVKSISISASGYSANSFEGCTTLRQIIYTSEMPPQGWVASANTYIPSTANYGMPSYSINNPKIIELLSWESTNFVYSGISPELPNYTCNLPGYTVTFEKPILSKDVGSYTIIISATFANDEESFVAEIPYSYTIRPSNILVSINPISRDYGDPNPEFLINYDGLVNNESIEVLDKVASATTTAKQSSNVGKYPITASGAQALNYTFTYTPGELTILPAPLSASINSTSREYGNSNPNFSLSFEGLKNGESMPAWIETPKFVTPATMASPVGEYPITATATPKNYELNSISDGVLSILPAKLKVIAQNKSRLYYEENPEFTFYYSGFRNGETESIVSNVPFLTTSATMESNSGKYDILISNISAPNYEIQYQTGVLTINPRNLSVNTGIYERSYGEENPEFELTYDGFVSGQNESDLTTPPKAYTNATNTTSVGSYPIYIGGGVAQNYSFSYSQGKLNIVKAEQDIIWNQDLTNLSKGQQIELLAYSTSGLPITYAIDIDSATVCEVYSVGNKKYLDCIGEGEVQLRATQEGNSNYYSSPRISKTVIVGGSTPQKPILSILQLPVGSITTPVNWGSIFAFTLQPNSGWKINAISINGEDFTNRLDKNGTFTTPAITKDSKIIISYEDVNTSVQDTECSKPKIIGYDGGIKVSNASLGLSVYIYSVEGYLIKSTVCESDEVLIPLSPNTTYIVKLGNFTGKIRL